MINGLGDLPQIRHRFFTRNRGDERYGTANCAFRAPAEHADVAATRAHSLQCLGADALATVQQRHTADVVVVDQPWSWDRAPVADAMVTRRPHVALGILTADCAPVLLADSDAGVIAAAHAGWRGAFDGIVENTVTTMVALGAVRARIVAAVGPCIGAASYEVGPEFQARFIARDPAYERYFRAADPRPHFDLARFVRDRLAAAGIATITIDGRDTVVEEAVFFSYRRATLRGETDYGRQLSAIALVTAS